MAENKSPSVIVNRTPDSTGASANTTEPATHVNPLAEKKALTQEQIKYYERMEATTVGGARVLTPKQQLMDFSDLAAQNPDKHYRWLNTANKEKMEQRITEGYQRVAESEGGRMLGENALFVIPKSRAEARIRRQDDLTRARLNTFKQDVSQAAESVARQLRDRHGIRVDPNRILIDER